MVRLPHFCGGFFVVLLALFVFFSVRESGSDGMRPPPPGDTQDYDNIALQLLLGHGFAYDFGDREWRRPYERHNEEGIYDDILARRGGVHATTARAPLLPLLLAATYGVAGRSFLLWRLVNSVLVAAALTLVAAVAWRAFGPRVALIAAGLTLVTESYVRYVAEMAIATETLATVFLAWLVWAIARLAGWKLAIACGVIAGLLALDRSFYVLWIPAIALLAGILGGWRRGLLCLGVAVALQVPWWIRNSVVLGGFQPLGTQGGTNMYAAWSDLAVAHRGQWWPASDAQQRRAFEREAGVCEGCGEEALARYGVRGARIWIASHPREAAWLAASKAAETWASLREVGIVRGAFWMALAAPFVIWRRRAAIDRVVALSMIAFVLLTLAVIAMTWTVGWRFMVPVEPFLAVLAAIPLVALVWGDEAVAGAPLA